MKIVAKQAVERFLVELEEDEVEDAEAAGWEIVRAEGSDPPNVPRLWVDDDELDQLVGACYGEAGAHDFRRGITQLQSGGATVTEMLRALTSKEKPS